MYLMPYRLTKFLNNHFYHIFNRGVEKRKIFFSKADYERFLETIHYYQFGGTKPKLSTRKRYRLVDFDKAKKIVKINCYCFMPNHFHLLLEQAREKGIQEFMSKVLNSYTKYYNTKHKRVGHLFQGTFKAVAVETDEQLIHLSRYIHLNPFASQLTNNPESYAYSSYEEFLGKSQSSTCVIQPIMSSFKNISEYKKFVSDQKSYARDLHKIKSLAIES